MIIPLSGDYIVVYTIISAYATKRRNKMSKKVKFWINSEMNELMSKFKDMHITSMADKTIKVKPDINKAERDELYLQIYIKHAQMAEVVAPHIRGPRFDERIDACVAKLYENLMFNWSLDQNRNSYGYFWRCAYNFTMDFIQGRFNGSTDLYSRKYTQSGTIIVEHGELPKGDTIETYAGWLASQSAWKDYKITIKDNSYSIKWRKQYKPFTSFDNDVYDIADTHDSRFDLLEEQIDWQILSEYIPDVECNETNRALAYVLIEALQEILARDEMSVNYKALNLMLFEMVQSKSPIVVSRPRLLEVRNILRQAYKYYAEDFIDYDEMRRLTTVW
jgi:hypothetical protein